MPRVDGSARLARRPDRRKKKIRRERIRREQDVAMNEIVNAPTLQDRVTSLVDSVDFSELSSVVDLARAEENIYMQPEVVSACLRRVLQSMNLGTATTPRPEQVRCLRRLIFNKDDTLLVTCTGFGKSLIFHAFSVLTRKITIQIIPLSKLGDEQLTDIRKIPGTNPCLITADTKKKECGLLRDIKAGMYAHILLGPEQASSRLFRRVLRDVSFQSRVGLVAVDECHLVRQWEAFRPEFSMLCELRILLHQDVIWFGCTATLDAETERIILSNTGFRSVGRNLYQTEVIRTSIDRPDISICLRPLMTGQLTSFNALYFLLDACQDHSGLPTPMNIPKTVVFVDSRAAVARVATYLRQALVKKTESNDRQSSLYETVNHSTYCVFDVVEIFISHVSKHDRDTRYREFTKAASTIRIMIATAALGMGVNVPDVERVVLWKFTLTKDLGDYWQRLGRGDRGINRTSVGYIFLPYWLFDTEGRDRPKAAEHASPTTIRQPSRIMKKKMRRSGLSQSQSMVELSDAFVLGMQRVARYWTKTEQERREQLTPEWRDLVNGPCHRRAFLSYLGEDKLPSYATLAPTPKESCCSRCNPDLFPSVLTQAPVLPQPLTKPRANTRAAVALVLLDTWACARAEERYSHPYRRFPMPASAYMPVECRWQLAPLFNKPDSVVWDTLSVDVLRADVAMLREWLDSGASSDGLVDYLRGLVDQVEKTYQARIAATKDKMARSKRPQDTRHEPNGTLAKETAVPSSAIEAYRARVRSSDDSLSRRVCQQEAIKATERQPSIALSQWVQGILNPSASQSESAPVDATPGMLRMMEVIKRVRAADAVRPVLSPPQDPVYTGDDTQYSVVTDSQSSVVMSSECTDVQPVATIDTQVAKQQSKRSSSQPQRPDSQVASEGTPERTPKRSRTALQERDVNKGLGLTFSPSTRAGRKRTLTQKGSENMKR